MTYPLASSTYGPSMNGKEKSKENSMLNITFPQPPDGYCWRIADAVSGDLIRLELLGPPNWRGSRPVIDWTVLNTNPATAGPIQCQVSDRGRRLLLSIEGLEAARAVKAQLVGLTSCEGNIR